MSMELPTTDDSNDSATTPVRLRTPKLSLRFPHIAHDDDDEEDDATGKRNSYSLPLIFEGSQLCALGGSGDGGMECMPLRTSTGPYHHYHVAPEQTKSLQELQNEVGALLEFRDLVIETFPDLKHKMASISQSNTITGVPSSSLASRREWEPGIRVRRKLAQKESATELSSSLIRSRSNSHSGKKEPKSGEGTGSVVQDSGFSTETSSSKETHSASSSNGAGQSTVVSSNPAQRMPLEAEDELWNLLDVIHRKSTRLREEVEHLQSIEKERTIRSSSNVVDTFQNELTRFTPDDVQILRKERDRLLDKLSEMEAETLTGRIQTSKLHEQVQSMYEANRDLENQLKSALNQKVELNSRIHEIHQQYVNTSTTAASNSGSDAASQRLRPNTTIRTILGGSALLTNAGTAANTFSPVVLKSDFSDGGLSNAKHLKNELNLGRLDGVVSSPNRAPKVRVADSKKIAAILLETNAVELQRHLLTLTVQNQVLTQRLEQATKSKIFLIKKLDKAKEDIDHLRFQLEERNIELEGTKAQMRILESRTFKHDFSPDHGGSITMIPIQVSTPSMKAMTPLQMDDIQHHSSSTESAQDQTERTGNHHHHNTSGGSPLHSSTSSSRMCPDTPKRRPSKIPLPGTKGYLAPKPPTGRSPGVQQRSPSGPPSNKSLTKSTGSLYGRSGPPSAASRTKDHRPDSAQSVRHLNNNKDQLASLGTSKSSSSSIPVCTTASSSSTSSSPSSAVTRITPPRVPYHTTSSNSSSTSPVAKAKRRDSMTSRVRNMDSLSRVSSSNYNSNSSSTTTPHHQSSNTNTNSLYKSSSKKDLSSSFTNGQNRDRKQSVVRRVSSASIKSAGGRSDNSPGDQDTGKVRNIRASFWNWLKI